MRKISLYLMGAVWAVVLLGGAFRPAAPAPGGAPRPQPGSTAPAFTLTDVSGKPVALEQYRRKAVFLNFWASWCGPCRLEMPEIQRLAANPPADSVVLTVNATATESGPEAVQAFLTAAGYSFPTVLDPAGTTVDAYKVISFPTSLFVSQDGVVTARVSGPLTHTAMLDYLRAARR